MTDQTKSLPTILIVEDEEFHVKSLVNLLGSHYRIKVALNGEQALKLLQNNTLPDLILLDVIMPGLSGYETCTKIKHDEKLSQIPVIFITAKSDSKDIVKGFEVGAVDYITKPFNPPELYARVKTHLELKESKETIAIQSAERKALIHILCHDLANPVTGIKGMIELMGMEAIDFKTVQNVFEVSINNAYEIIEMVKKMEALSDEKLELVIKTLKLQEMLDDSLVMLDEKINNKKIQVNIDLSGPDTVKVERTSFVNSVLNNLLTNAIKFSENGGKINIESKAAGDHLTLIIQDYGIGIPEHLMPRLFDVGKSISRKGTSGEHGTGYGMALVKRFVEYYGGEIEVESNVKSDINSEHGTKVILKLPV